jgi:hypothetical protein
LKLSTDVILVQAKIILLGQQHVLILRLVVLNGDWPRWSGWPMPDAFRR